MLPTKPNAAPRATGTPWTTSFFTEVAVVAFNLLAVVDDHQIAEQWIVAGESNGSFADADHEVGQLLRESPVLDACVCLCR